MFQLLYRELPTRGPLPALTMRSEHADREAAFYAGEQAMLDWFREEPGASALSGSGDYWQLRSRDGWRFAELVILEGAS